MKQYTSVLHYISCDTGINSLQTDTLQRVICGSRDGNAKPCCELTLLNLVSEINFNSKADTQCRQQGF